MPWVEVGDTDIYYQDEGDGPPLVFLHGMSSCGEAWFQQFEAFRDRYRVIAYDSVNHGHSSNSPRDESEPDRADELEGFLAALGIEQPVLAGNSMGAFTLVRWACRHPGDARALIPSGMGVPRSGQPQIRPDRGAIGDDVLFLPTGDSLTEGFRSSNPRMFERYLRIRSTATRIEALRHPRRRTLTDPAREGMREAVGRIRSPMLIIVGSLDRALPAAENMHELVPGSRLEVIEGAPHNVYYEAGAAYNDLASDFLKNL